MLGLGVSFFTFFPPLNNTGAALGFCFFALLLSVVMVVFTSMSIAVFFPPLPCTFTDFGLPFFGVFFAPLRIIFSLYPCSQFFHKLRRPFLSFMSKGQILFGFNTSNSTRISPRNLLLRFVAVMFAKHRVFLTLANEFQFIFLFWRPAMPQCTMSLIQNIVFGFQAIEEILLTFNKFIRDAKLNNIETKYGFAVKVVGVL